MRRYAPAALTTLPHEYERALAASPAPPAALGAGAGAPAPSDPRLRRFGTVHRRLAEHAELSLISSFELQHAHDLDLYDPAEWSWRRGLNFSLAAMLPADVASSDAYLGEFGPEPSARAAPRPPNGSLLGAARPPPPLDWVESGIVPADVWDQGMCASCWAFVAADAVAAANALAAPAASAPASLSSQQIVSCDDPTAYGCLGGTPAQALTYARTEAVKPAEAYPYASYSGQQPPPACRLHPGHASARRQALKVGGYRSVRKGDEDAMLSALQHAPLAVGIDADSFEFLHYRKGVLDVPACGTGLNHAVLIVGHGVDGGLPYWRVKNSWGESWGEAGFMRLARGRNMCGIADLVVYAVAPGSDDGAGGSFSWSSHGFLGSNARTIAAAAGVVLLLGIAACAASSSWRHAGARGAAAGAAAKPTLSFSMPAVGAAPLKPPAGVEKPGQAQALR